MKGRWVHSEGRQEKAYIKIILDLEKKRDALINIKENKQKTENTKEKTDLHERNLRELKLKMIK